MLERTEMCLALDIKAAIGGGAGMPIGHWRSSSETGTPTVSSGVELFEQRPLRRYFLLTR